MKNKISYLITIVAVILLTSCDIDDDDDKNHYTSFRYVESHYSYTSISNPYYYEESIPYYSYTYTVYYDGYYDVYDVYDCGCYYDQTRYYYDGSSVVLGIQVAF